MFTVLVEVLLKIDGFIWRLDLTVKLSRIEVFKKYESPNTKLLVSPLFQISGATFISIQTNLPTMSRDWITVIIFSKSQESLCSPLITDDTEIALIYPMKS